MRKNNTTKVNLAEINTHIVYIKDSIKQINSKLDMLPCSNNISDIKSNRTMIKEMKDARVRELTVFSIVMTIIFAIVNFLMR